MTPDRADDHEKLRRFDQSLDEAREDLRLHGPVSSDEVKKTLDRLHAEWDLEDAKTELTRDTHSTV